MIAKIKNPNRLNHDIAEILMKEIEEVAEKSKVKIKRREPLQIEDLEIIEKDKNCVKQFCLFYNKIQESLLVETKTLSLNQTVSGRPPTIKICAHLEKKLNRGHEAKDSVINDFAYSLVSTKSMVTPARVTLEDITEALKDITKTKTPWINGISPNHLINAMKESPNLVKVVKVVLEMSFKSGVLPDSMCWDLVIFLFKKGQLNDPANFRPICIDNPLTKLACQLINKKLVSHLREYMSDKNYSYRAGKSTQQAIIQLCNVVSDIRSRGNFALVFCTDMSGAFETIQQRLIDKLMSMKIKDSENFKGSSWVNDYLLSKRLVTKDEEGNLIPINRHLKTVGSGQGSKISPNLWLLQSGAAIFRLDFKKPEYLDTVRGLDLFQIVFADDNIGVNEFNSKSAILNVAFIRSTIDEFLKLWNEILSDNGMILNTTKTEVLCRIDQEKPYPPLKSSIVWLGITLTMTADGFIEANVEENIKNIRLKTLGKFSELTHLTTNVTVRLRTFQLFIEPIIDFNLIICILSTSNWQKTCDKLQVIQNTFLRRVAQIGKIVKINKLHEYLGVRTVEWKLHRMAASEWEKLPKHTRQNHKLLFTRSTRSEGLPIINTVNDCLKALHDDFYKKLVKECKPEFDLEKFTKWKKKKQDKMKGIVAEKARTLSNDRKRKADHDEYRADIEKKMKLMYDIQ